MPTKKATAQSKPQAWAWTWESPKGKIVREAFGSRDDAKVWAENEGYDTYKLVKVWLVKK